MIGTREREIGRIAAKVSLRTTRNGLLGFIERRVRYHLLVYTDDHGGYGNVCQKYGHWIICYSKKEYVRKDCHLARFCFTRHTPNIPAQALLSGGPS